MKKLLLISIISIIAIAGYAQDKAKTDKSKSDKSNNDKISSDKNIAEFWEAIQTKRIAFFTDNIGLTSAEAQQFWPVYNAFDKERQDLMTKRKMLEKKLEESKTGLSDSEYRKIANDFVATHIEEAKLIENYNAKYFKILPAEKVCKLYRAERKFREYLMHEFREKGLDKK
jgi:hypothetical protein